VWVITKRVKKVKKTVVACCGFPSSGSLGSCSRKRPGLLFSSRRAQIFEEEKLLLLLLLLLLPYPRRYIYIKTQRKEEMVALTSRRRALIFNVYLPQIPPFFLLLLF
jgi:hypothetical protein